MDFAPFGASWFLLELPLWLPLMTTASSPTPSGCFDHDAYHRNRETKTGYHLMKEGTSGLSSPMAKRLTGFGAELVHLVCRPGASKNTVHVPMLGAGEQRGVRIVLEGYLVCTWGGQKTSSRAQKS